ncbi:hypothetical protein SAMN02800692_3368 [Luteibacter sp. UNC138MFCol5.1]|uniref:hypothetical protein n=1 Tax=Luteibacter sp. UNC138MFCol5.1 TaxID=1502774 RepID=UPI0008C5226A|nr:hypothetical protein [Luteibacter sp. UNC138MFCol5.1]SEP04460.1 hypothetical protein SAMN02800692_3368 [Luteibacter sp. UNC138MFCol5.1]
MNVTCSGQCKGPDTSLVPTKGTVFAALAMREGRRPGDTLMTVDSKAYAEALDERYEAQGHDSAIMANDQLRMGSAFTRFAEALVPMLARLAVERPDVVSRTFDLRKDGQSLKVVDADLDPDQAAWLEARLNELPDLLCLATEFNRSVAYAYGDGSRDYYLTETVTGYIDHPPVANLDATVDRDVRFMSLLRSVRDADVDNENVYLLRDHYKANPYALAAIKVRDFVIPADTYRPVPGGGLAVSKAVAGPILSTMA